MVTSFFGSESFGGDATYVDRLSRALLRAGHEVEVAHSPAAYEAVRGSHPGRPYDPPPGLAVHRLNSPAGRMAPVWAHQTGRLGPLAGPIEELFATGRFDVIHLHNISLLGGAELIERSTATGAVTLVAAHDHWHVCPLSTLWRPEGELCTRPRCVSCAVRAGRPPQLWRLGRRLGRALAAASAVVYPSEHTRRLHGARGVAGEPVVLPYFIPDRGADPDPVDWRRGGRPYLAAAGRLVDEKGFDELLAAMEVVAGIDLVLAGSGPAEPELRRRAAGSGNVRFASLLDESGIRGLFGGALAVVVPSRFWETFGYVVAEAAALGTPTIVRDRGPLAEHAAALGSPTFGSARELEGAIERLASDRSLRDRLGGRARDVAADLWSEAQHVSRYESLVERSRGGRARAAATGGLV